MGLQSAHMWHFNRTTTPLSGGVKRTKQSPVTIYLIWLPWLHSRRPELLEGEAGRGEGARDVRVRVALSEYTPPSLALPPCIS